MTINQAAQRLGSTLMFSVLNDDILSRVAKFDTEKLDTSEDHLFDLLAEAIAIMGDKK